MKKCIIYSITIYLLLTMIIILQKPQIMCDQYGNFKSLNYLKYKLSSGITNLNDLICLPIIFILCSIFSFIVSTNLVTNKKI